MKTLFISHLFVLTFASVVISGIVSACAPRPVPPPPPHPLTIKHPHHPPHPVAPGRMPHHPRHLR